MSPLARPDQPGSLGRCRTHRRPLLPAARPVPGELDAANALAEEARQRMRESTGAPIGSGGKQRQPRGYCPDCVAEAAAQAVQRLIGPDLEQEEPPMSADLWAELEGLEGTP